MIVAASLPSPSGLVHRRRAALVAPFALLIRFAAASSSSLVFGDRFGTRRLPGMALVRPGLAVIVSG